MKSVLIIAEAGVNHNGSFDTAMEMVDVAKEVGADAIKFQTFKASKYISVEADKAQYQLAATDKKETQVDMMTKLELSHDEFRELKGYCDTKKIEFISTPFEVESIEFLKSLGVARLKIPSGEITNTQLLYHAAQTKLPVILSTGMATLEEIQDALSILAVGYSAEQASSIEEFRKQGSNASLRSQLSDIVTILHCTTEYPAPFSDVNLKAIAYLEKQLQLPIGFSDHTLGISAALAAVACGACVVEKHFTLDRNSEGPDHKASLEPNELKALVSGVREVEQALGREHKGPTASELKNIPIARKSLVAACDIKNGEVFTPENLTAKRPATGVSALLYYDWLDKQAARNIGHDQVLVKTDQL